MLIENQIGRGSTNVEESDKTFDTDHVKDLKKVTDQESEKIRKEEIINYNIQNIIKIRKKHISSFFR